jgi:hypothetical protein
LSTISIISRLARSPQVAGPNECIDGILAGQYLNTDAVRAAIHVIGRDRLPQWTVCTDAIDYTSNIPALYPEPYLTLIKNYRVLVFNGGKQISYGFLVQISDVLSFETWLVAFVLLGFLALAASFSLFRALSKFFRRSLHFLVSSVRPL